MEETLLRVFKFKPVDQVLAVDDSTLEVLDPQKPLSQIWRCYAFHERWLLKYWKHSRWIAYVQLKLDLGYRLEDVIQEILDRKAI